MPIQFNLIHSKMAECSETGKAIILTAFIKMTNRSSEIVPQVQKVMEAHQNHWNVEIQSRACEYLQMIDLQTTSVDQEQKDLVANALEKMPNFSNEIQTNNVLTKRILALKVKDGLHINV